MASSSPSNLDTSSQPSQHDSTLARVLAPEDVRPGDYVALLDEMFEYPSFWWCIDATLLPPHELVRLRLLPRDDGRPLKVRGVCLPFVLAKEPRGTHRTLDLRRCRLARLDRSFAQTAWRAYKKKSRPRR
jgi:hypothetical protein